MQKETMVNIDSSKPQDIGKVHDDVELAKLVQNLPQADIAKVVESVVIEEKEEVNLKSTQHRFPIELVKIFKTLGMHAPVGIRPPGAAVHRAKMNMRRKASRGR